MACFKLPCQSQHKCIVILSCVLLSAACLLLMSCAPHTQSIVQGLFEREQGGA